MNIDIRSKICIRLRKEVKGTFFNLPNTVRNGLLIRLRFSVIFVINVAKKEICFVMVLTIASSIKKACLELGFSLRSKSNTSDFSNHLPHVLPETTYLTKAFSNFQQVSFAVLPS